MGICFVGKRDFGSFISEYVEPRRGRFVPVGGGPALGEHSGLAGYTTGQRARLGGATEAWYVVGKECAEDTRPRPPSLQQRLQGASEALAQGCAGCEGSQAWLFTGH